MVSPMQLLIVDDERAISDELADYAAGRGAAAETANRFDDAVDSLRAHPEITVMLSDIRMPGRNGLSLLTRALAGRDEANALEVVLMTGHATIDDAIAAVQRKAFDFVRKPFGLAALWGTLEQANASALARRAAAASAAANREKAEQRGRAAAETTDMVRDLGTAVAGRQLAVHYQPQVNLATGALCGVEALLRWNRPGHGPVPPDRFVEAAEDSGLIVPVGLWVLREACQRAAAWPGQLGIAVNVSPVQLRDPGLYQAVLQVIRETGIAPSRLELEITEGVMLRDSDGVLETLRRLRDLGVRLAMDDFGTGYSNLGYLQKFRFDTVKIDRAFINRLGEDASAAAVVRAVVGMASSLGFRVIAEGVETPAQAEALLASGCSEGQGFLYGKAVPGDAFDAALPDSAPGPVEDAVSRGPAAHLRRPIG
jgi:EAL domain-containing protein (putative c-di-GMP-specific phosphodiesterase class I)/FixJ family two-component response regulator